MSFLAGAYQGKRVLVTGHTGFKGSWLTLWLAQLGADTTGYSLPAPEASLFAEANVASACRHIEADVRDRSSLRRVFQDHKPEIVFHLAAQALVRRSYAEPIETVETNIIGTANLLEMARTTPGVRAVVVVTSDKCYESSAAPGGHRETDPMGGHDVYSMSKGAAELVVASYRHSFFLPSRLREHGVAVATARAGNVIGGGDWAEDRIVPDAVRALQSGAVIQVRNPRSIRPWQHVLEPLGGYLLLGARLLGAGAGDPAPYCEAWNFGPAEDNSRTVAEVVDAFIASWGSGSWSSAVDLRAVHETAVLRLNAEKARERLGWSPKWDFHQTIAQTVAWYRARHQGILGSALRDLCIGQISAYAENLGWARGAV